MLFAALFLCWTASGDEKTVRTYEYKGFDTNGVLQVTGVITLRLDDADKITGEWELRVLDRAKLKEAGPQDGKGKIRGYLRGEKIFLNLNPGQIDTNIYLDGIVSGTDNFEIKGKWGYYGFVGRVKDGTFEMVQKKSASK